MGRSRNEVFRFDARADTSDLDKMSRAIDDFADSITDMGDAMDDAGKEADGSSGSLSNWADAAIIAQGAAGVLNAAMSGIASGFGASIGFWSEQAGLMNQVQAATGLTGAALSDFEQQAQDVFNAGFGDDFADITSAMIQVRNITGQSGEALENLTSKALILDETFGADVTESIRTVDTLMDNFGISGDQAFDLITKGFQETGDPAADLLDSLNEYSGNFVSMGITAPIALGLMNQGLEAGARNTDDMADALREFENKLIDGTSQAAIRSLSEESASLFQAYSDGEATASQVLQQVNNDLRDIENPLVRNQLGVEIWGTRFEDAGEKAILAMDPATAALEDVEGATDAAGSALEQGFGPAWDRLGRKVQTTIDDQLDRFAPVIIESVIPAVDSFTNWINTTGIPALTTFGTNVAVAFGGITAAAGTIKTAFAEGDLQGVIDGFTTMGESLTAIDPSAWIDSAIIQPIKDYFGTVDWVMLFSSTVEFVTPYLEAVATAVAEFDYDTWIDEKIVTPIGTAFSAIDWVTGFAAVSEFVTPYLDAIATSIAEFDYGVWIDENVVTPIGTAISNIDWTAAISGGADFLGSLLDGLATSITEFDPATAFGDGGGIDLSVLLGGLINTQVDLSMFVLEEILTPLGEAFANADYSALGESLLNLGDALASSLPDWGVWAQDEIIDPMIEGLTGLYAAIATAINNAIPDEIGFDMTIPRPDFGDRVPGWVQNRVPDPLFSGGIAIPIPPNPLPIQDLGGFSTGGSFITPDGGLPIPGSTDRQFAIGLTPGEPVQITPRGQAGMANNSQPQVIQLVMDGRVLTEVQADRNNRMANRAFQPG